MANALGIISYTGENVYVKGISKYRPVAAYAYVGRYRLVDIPISNMTNSGIQNIQVYTNGDPKVLFNHIGSARHYNINNKHGHVSIIPVNYALNAPEYVSDMYSYYRNLDEITDNPNDYVVIAPTNWIYKANFSDLLDRHIASRADVSVLYHRYNDIPSKSNLLNANQLISENGELKEISRYLGTSESFDACLETYILSKEYFVKLIKEAVSYSPLFWLKDIISYKLKKQEIKVNMMEYSYPVFPILSLKSYFDSNMEMLKERNMAFFNDSNWPIYTRTNDSAPTIYIGEGTAQGALISNGCEIAGKVIGSILGRGVKVGAGAVVNNCLILPGAEIGENVMLTNAIVDKDARVIHSREITGYDEEPFYVKRRETY